jgi:methanogenic corrinoid protein MtbC1
MNGKGYSIAATARLTGLSVDTLRAWERRYRMVTPERDHAGIRWYNTEEVDRLKLARAATEAGHPIRRLASLDNDELRALIVPEVSPVDESEHVRSVSVSRIIEALRAYDIPEAERLLSMYAALFSPPQLVLDVLVPLMNEVGESWERGTLTIAQEHLASNLVRNLTGTLSRYTSNAAGERMLFATPPGEPHEFGVLFAATLAAVGGRQTCMLGPNVPALEIVDAARHVRPAAVVIAAHKTDVEARLAFLETIDAKLPKTVEIWLGGQGFSHEDALRIPERARYIPTLEEFAGRVA